MRDAWRLCTGTFLAVPVAPPRRVDAEVAGRAMLLAPLTAVPTAVLWVALAALVVVGWVPALVAGVVAVSLTALLSRGMHLDGLADTADGLSSSLDRDRALQVMRRGDTGPNGAAALVLGLLLQVACLGTLLASVTGATLAATALVASRLAPAIACRRGVPPARPSGLGRTVAGTVAGWGLVVAVTAVALISVPAVQLTASRSPWYAVALAPALVVASGCGVAWFLVNRATARLGGVTGDVIGAAIETALAAALVVGTVCVGVLTP